MRRVSVDRERRSDDWSWRRHRGGRRRRLAAATAAAAATGYVGGRGAQRSKADENRGHGAAAYSGHDRQTGDAPFGGARRERPEPVSRGWDVSITEGQSQWAGSALIGQNWRVNEARSVRSDPDSVA